LWEREEQVDAYIKELKELMGSKGAKKYIKNCNFCANFRLLLSPPGTSQPKTKRSSRKGQAEGKLIAKNEI